MLIENQLERTDHGHFGQLLTYAAGLEAVTIVWIAAKFTEEHRAALDWLNQRTDESVNFFGLEIELWRIGESAIAPKLNIVSEPNNWRKAVAGGATSQSGTSQLQVEYWTALCQYLEDHASPLRPSKPYPQSWLFLSLARPNCKLGAVMLVSKRELVVQVSLLGPQRHAVFRLLEERKDQIEAEIGTQLTWDIRLDKTESQIIMARRAADPGVRNDWPAQFEWFRGQLESLYRAFAPRLHQLDLAG